MSNVIKGESLGALDTKAVRVIGAEAIKQGHAGYSRRNRKVTPEELARSIVDEADQEAAALVSAAHQEAEQIRSAAHKEGFEAGFKELDEERATLAERVAELEADLERRVEEFWVEIEPQLLKLAVDIARKIVCQEVSEHQEFVLNMVKVGLRQLRDRHEIRIRVNPADYEFVRGQKDEIASSCDGIRALEIIDDRRVDEGGCIIESSHGHLDARLETQFEEAERALLEAACDGQNEIGADSG